MYAVIYYFSHPIISTIIAYSDTAASVCGVDWGTLFNAAEIAADDLWYTPYRV